MSYTDTHWLGAGLGAMNPRYRRRSWWSRTLTIPGYAAGWLGDHLINILIMVFVVLVAAFMFPPL